MKFKLTLPIKAILIFSFLFTPLYSTLAFNDTTGSSHEKAIEYLAQRGVVEGYADGTYRPSSSINRAEYTKILIESKFPNQAKGANCFPDVNEEWFAKYICYADFLGFVQGYPGGHFGPNERINLAEALKIIFETYEIEICKNCYQEWYEPYYLKAKETNILEKINENLADKITRGEMAQLIYNTENYLNGINAQKTEEIIQEEGVQNSDENKEDELSFPKGGDVQNVPNVVILEFPADSPWRWANGNVNLEGVIQEFYANQGDDFDMLISANLGEFNGKYNDVSNGSIKRYLPTNIGQTENCGTMEDPNCENKPDRLRHSQQIGDFWMRKNLTGILHEVAHYWGVGWHESKSLSCFEPWVNQGLENGHWTPHFSAGTFSPLTYRNGVVSGEFDNPDLVLYGYWEDNKDGTFTLFPQTAKDMKFNYMDLYAMGLMSEEELAEKEMYVVLDPVFTGKYLYLTEGQAENYYFNPKIFEGTRHTVTLDDFKNLLKEKEACKDYYEEGDFYTGDGTRIPNERDSEKELAKEFRVAFVLIKNPEQKISYEQAYNLCQRINHDVPEAWNKATFGRSVMHTYLSEGGEAPDCKALFAS